MGHSLPPIAVVKNQQYRYLDLFTSILPYVLRRAPPLCFCWHLCVPWVGLSRPWNSGCWSDLTPAAPDLLSPYLFARHRA